MSRKRFLITALVLVVLAGLVYLQVRAWKKFDWHRFWVATHNTNKFYLVAGVALVYADYILRALRWKILLRPVCEAKTADLVAPTVIGFAGLALLGRPGEFIRPYLISRKVNLSMASQLAVWTVERIFDMGAFALIMAVNILWSRDTLRKLPGFADSARRHFLGREISSLPQRCWPALDWCHSWRSGYERIRPQLQDFLCGSSVEYQQNSAMR
jgi:uncharacterized membrane protein YbhN (UPF0104 family)